MSKTIVIYHKSDFDGIFCREIARKFLPGAELIGWEYGEPEPPMPPDLNQLFMLDISVAGLMDNPRLIWIDHHKSAMEKWDKASIHGFRIDGVAACRLAWQWFSAQLLGDKVLSPPALFWKHPTKEDFIVRNVVEPLAVRLAGEYDIWDRRDPRAELFQHGLRSMDLEPHWPALLSLSNKPDMRQLEALIDVGHQNMIEPDGSFVPPIVCTFLEKGEAIQYFQTTQNASIIKAFGYDVDFEGLKFLACNHARFNSLLFTAGLRPEHDACMGFNWTGKQWRISLYHAPGKEHHDLSVIAVKYGGGGHRGACGFTMAELPFKL